MEAMRTVYAENRNSVLNALEYFESIVCEQ